MKNALKKTVSILLITIMVISAAPLTGFVGIELPDISPLFKLKANATGVLKQNAYTYIVDDNFAIIIDCDTSIAGEVVVPSELNGFIVNEISNSAFYDCNKITKVTLPSTINKIGSYAFYNCELLQQINLPDSIVEIGTYAFANCDAIEDIVLPKSLTNVEIGAFQNCSSLKKIVIPENVTKVKDSAFYYCSNLSEIGLHDNIVHIGNNAFLGTKYYKNTTNWKDNELYIGNHLIDVSKNIDGAYTIKENTKVISSHCFYGQYGLTEVSIPSSVTVIDEYAFGSCQSLTNVYISNGVEQIATYAFFTCNALTYINIPSSVKTIGTYAFMSSNLRSIELEEGLENIESGAFYCCSNLKSITLPESLKRIGSSVFYGCTSLETINYNAINCQPTDESPTITLFGFGNSIKNIYLGEKVQTIPSGIFSYCNLITSITIPKTVTKIGENAFGYCYNLKEIYYNAENCVEIGTKSINAFFDCSDVEKVYIGNDVEYIPAFAFTGCDNLKYVDIPEKLANIDDCAFAECYKLCIECDPNTYLHNYVLKNNIEYILTDSNNNTSFRIKNGVLCDYYGTSKDFVLPADVRTVGMNSFDSNNSIECIELPYSTTMILSNAFSNCLNLEKVVIPYTVTNIAENAFDNTSVSIICSPNSYAHSFATKKGIATETLSLVLNTNALSLSVNEEYSVIASTNPQTKLSVPVYFSSSNSNVASVNSNGKITANSIGNSTITVSSADGSMEAYCQVTVVSNNPDEPEIKTYTVKWIVDGNTTIQVYKEGDRITKPSSPSKNGYIFKEWTPAVPSTMPAYDLTFTAVWEEIVSNTCPYCNEQFDSESECISHIVICPSKPITPPAEDDNQVTIVIRNPSTTTISYGNAIILHADVTGTLPAGATIKWESSNGNFGMEVSADGTTCKISPSSKGDTTFTVSVVDANKNVISSDEQVMTSKAGFFDKIIAFFKKLFGLTKTIPQIYKGIF